MIIKIRTKPFELAMKNIFFLKKNLKHTCTHKSLLSIYIIHNYIIFVSLCPNFKNYSYFHVRFNTLSVSTTSK